MKCSECECLVRVKNKLGYNLYYCGYKKYGVLKALCGLYINNEEYRKDNETCKYYKAEKKGRKEMTEEEKAIDLTSKSFELEKDKVEWFCSTYKNSRMSEIHTFYNGVLVGLAEGRKEVTYMKAEEYDQYLDACRKNIQLEEENAKLKAENKQIIERERVVPEHYLVEMIEKCKELKAQIEEQKAHCKAVDEVNKKLRCCGNCKHAVYSDSVIIDCYKDCKNLDKWELA